MDRNFARSLALVLKSEGGWSDNPADPGGATMKGVTIANFRTYVKADASKDDLHNITDAQLSTVYRRFYWDAVAGAELPDGLDYAVFDFAVNSGPTRAAKYLQDALGILQDGRIGPATLTAINAMPAADVINELCDARMAFLHRLATWPVFGNGWKDRVKSVRAQALAMAAQAVVDQTPAAPAPVQMPEKPIVVTQTGTETPVLVPNAPTPEVAKPTIPRGKTGIASFIAIVVSMIAGFLKLHFGG